MVSCKRLDKSQEVTLLLRTDPRYMQSTLRGQNESFELNIKSRKIVAETERNMFLIAIRMFGLARRPICIK